LPNGIVELAGNEPGKLEGKYSKLSSGEIPQFFLNYRSDSVDGVSVDSDREPNCIPENIVNNHMYLAEIISNLSKTINGVHRYSMYLDYVVSHEIDKKTFAKYREILEEQWKKEFPTPPIALTYCSASLGNIIAADLIVVPIRIAYAYRAFYLVAYGQCPQGETGYYNFRIDRIQELKPLSWDASEITSDLQLQEELDDVALNPLDEIQSMEGRMYRAWGFDCYEQQRIMILRFNSKFHDCYVNSSIRHPKFRRIDENALVRSIEKSDLAEIERKKILGKIEMRLWKDDAFYEVPFRVNENNIILRLRAWGPNVEVLAPTTMRDRMAEDLKAAGNLY